MRDERSDERRSREHERHEPEANATSAIPATMTSVGNGRAKAISTESRMATSPGRSPTTAAAIV